MQAGPFDEAALFAAIAPRRALLIGRRALIALGIPVLTADYGIWLHGDDIESLNASLEPLDLFPNRPPDEARRHGRYVLENDERVDVLVAKRVGTVDGIMVAFDDVWSRRQALEVAPGITIAVPALDDLISTKRFAARARDLDDIQLLEALRRQAP